MKKNIVFRIWYYFRQGWTTYFAFVFAAINTLIVTYYLAIENIAPIKEIFPSFFLYFIAVSSIGIPLLVLIGYVHFKKSPAYSSETDITVESNPYHYKLPKKGWNQEVSFPLYLMITNYILKSNDLTEEETAEIKDLQKKIQKLINGEFINEPRKKI